jgi:hypothetical protein
MLLTDGQKTRSAGKIQPRVGTTCSTRNGSKDSIHVPAIKPGTEPPERWPYLKQYEIAKQATHNAAEKYRPGFVYVGAWVFDFLPGELCDWTSYT